LVSVLIEEQLSRLPESPGVYLFRDAEGTILYVGKAASLRHRVRSYFGVGQKLSPKLLKMVSRMADIDFYITSSEQEALILELNLINNILGAGSADSGAQPHQAPSSPLQCKAEGR